MSETTLPTPARLGAEEAVDADRPLLPAGSIAAPLSALSFWLAIGLPALYLPLLITGLSTVSDLLTFLALFGLHVLALIGGRSYRRD